MFRRVLRISSFAAVIVAAMLGAAASATAATQLVTNGDFETGTLEGWTTSSQGSAAGEWHLYSRQGSEGESGAIGWAPPPSGEFAAASTNLSGIPGTSYLFQDIAVPEATTDQLSMYLYYRSFAPIAVPTPNTLLTSESPLAQPNQQIRVDVLKPTATIESLSPEDVLATVYASKPGDQAELQPTVLSADLSPFAGQTVRLRIVSVAQAGGMEVGADGISVDSTPLAAPQPQPSPATPLPSNAFTVGKMIRDRRHGGAKLDVTLPGAGTLTVADARRKIAIASVRADPSGKPILIRTASVQTAGPRTVTVYLRPTHAAKRLLGRAGKLPFRLQLTFAPEGGLAAAQGYAGTLMKNLRPARR